MKTAYDVIITPIISERSMDDAAEKKYTFKVDRRADKTAVKNAVEEAFGVDVERVNIMNFSGKMKRQGLHSGLTPSYKKAIVKLTKDSKTIEFFEGL